MRGLARMHLPERQRGAALLILLALFATAAAYMLVTSLNKSSVALTLARSDRNRAAMLEARAALIAWSASETLQGATFQPGSLPCPDRNNDGYAETNCGTAANRLGRLPYKTLGIGELRDASGELLWYAMSGRFRHLMGTTTINSDTQGQLSISGLAPASNVIAVVLAPGMRLGTQDRSPAGTSCNNSSLPCNTALNYLDGINGDTTTTNYVAATENLTDAVVANLFNDQLLAITHQDLFSVVDPVVAARIERDIVRQYIYDPTDTSTSTQWNDVAEPNKSRYFDAWGRFPFAAPFSNPGTSSFTGQAGTYEGLLPAVESLSYNWNLGSGSAAKIGGSGTIWSIDCSSTTTSNLTCTIIWSGYLTQPVIRMSGTVNQVGLSFVQLPQLSDVTTSGGSLSSRSLAGSVNNTGVGTVTLQATLPQNPYFFGSKNVTINIAQPVVSALTSSSTAEVAGWFNSNEWYKQTYYAVSPGYVPGGTPPCNATSPKCLSVDNLAPPNTNPTTDTRAIIVLAGRSLSGASRPNGTLANYLEAKNASTGDYAFEHSLGKTTTVAGVPVAINDRVIVIAP